MSRSSGAHSGAEREAEFRRSPRHALFRTLLEVREVWQELLDEYPSGGLEASELTSSWLSGLDRFIEREQDLRCLRSGQHDLIGQRIAVGHQHRVLAAHRVLSAGSKTPPRRRAELNKVTTELSDLEESKENRSESIRDHRNDADRWEDLNTLMDDGLQAEGLRRPRRQVVRRDQGIEGLGL